MLPKFRFIVKLQHQEPEEVTVISNDLRVASDTAIKSAQWKLGQKLNLRGDDGYPTAAGNQPEGLQLLGLGA